MNTNQLYKEYARVIEMCEVTELEDKPWVCVKGRCKSIFLNHPHFDRDPSEYEFAVAVLEGKPVFENDIVYRKEDGQKFLVDGIFQNERGLIKLDFDNSSAIWKQNNFAKCFTWTPPPKRTFMLNGVELPCPVSSKRDFTQTGFSIDNVPFCFESFEDAITVKQAIVNLLTEARDKHD
jgi:hypothetical protein